MTIHTIYVWCNRCAPEWHEFGALGDDGKGLCGHICSDHSFASNDMVNWNREIYDKQYGEGNWRTVLLEDEKCEQYNAGKRFGEFDAYELADIRSHPGLGAALALNAVAAVED